MRTAYSTCSDVDTRGHAHSCAHQRINDAFALAGGFRNTCGCARRADVCAVLCLLHSVLYVRCSPSQSADYCAAELDNPGLTCVPLTQDRIAGLSIYYGPTDTCEARRMRMPGPHAPCCARCCGGLACCAACALCVRALHARAHVCRKGCCVYDALLLRDIAMRAASGCYIRETPSGLGIIRLITCQYKGTGI